MTKSLKNALLGVSLTTLTVSVAAAQPPAGQNRPPTRELMRPQLPESGIETLPGLPATHYSSGARARAERLQANVAAMAAFYEERLGARRPVTLWVLNREHWQEMAPPGMPPFGPAFYTPTPTPPLLVIPAESGDLVHRMYLNNAQAIPPEELATFSGVPLEDLADRAVETLVLHEFGHELNRVYGIDARCIWLEEFLANYWMWVFIAERQPDALELFELFNDHRSQDRPANTTLEDWDRLGPGGVNIGWYQQQLQVRLREVYAQHGFDFLEAVRQEFPIPRGWWGPLPATEVLERLERIAPGFLAWNEGLQ